MTAAGGVQPGPAPGADVPRPRRGELRLGRVVLAPRHAALAAILALSGLLEFVKLSQNGYANTFYSAAVKSMLRSWHNFFFVSSDPNGFITVDKPPLALWLQGFSAKLFGFAPLSLIVPEGICALLAVALIYRIVAPRFGAWAGLVAAFALAVFPSFVAVSRDNAVDPLLILLMLAACGLALAAIDSGRLGRLVWCGVLVGLAFNTKSLAALLVVPGIAVGYLLCAPGSWRRRLGQLAVAGAVFLAVAVSWSLAVDLTPASQRPYVGGSRDNSEFQLEFGYNGFGRVGGQQGGPGTTKAYLTEEQLRPLVRPGIDVAQSAAERRYFATHKAPPAHPPTRKSKPAPPAATGRQRGGVAPFGGTRSPLRIFGAPMGGQAGWLVPLALIGMLAAALLVRRRRDRRGAALFVLGGWFLVELAVLDFSAGIVHPYYSSALGPGVAAMAGAGAVAIGSLVSSPERRLALRGYILAVVAVAGTLAVQLVLIHREGDPRWWRVALVVLCLGGLAAIPLVRRHAACGVAVAVAALLVAPMVFSFSVWLAPVEGTFPAAGPYSSAGDGGLDEAHLDVVADQGLRDYVQANGATRRYPLLTQSSDQAAPLILLGLRASAEGGYGASDPALGNERLATLVANGSARYLLISGDYADRGGNSGETAARLVCPEIPEIVWAPPGSFDLGGSYLVDCAGQADKLRHPYEAARAFLKAHPRVHYKL
jgi:4-amino-4-deoxy-L-arabinose transferase-like glycosyltransferase